MDSNEKYRAIRCLFDTIRDDSVFHEKWLSDIFLVNLLNIKAGHNFFISKSVFNKFMVHPRYGFESCDTFNSTNITGVFRKTYCHKRFYWHIKACLIDLDRETLLLKKYNLYFFRSSVSLSRSMIRACFDRQISSIRIKG